MAFQNVRDAATPPLSYIGYERVEQVQRMVWPKTGRKVIHVQQSSQLQCGLPATFQGQQAIVVDVQGTRVQLDQPMKMYNTDDFSLKQKLTTTDHNQMQHLVKDAWSDYWNLAEDFNEDHFFNTILADTTTYEAANVEPFHHGEWRHMLKELRRKQPEEHAGYQFQM